MFEVRGRLGIINDTFIIKPFARTLKVSHNKMILYQPNLPHQYLELEWNTHNEICSLLSIDEVEQCYELLERIQKRLHDVTHTDQTLTVTKSVQKGVCMRPYWTCINSLKEMSPACDQAHD